MSTTTFVDITPIITKTLRRYASAATGRESDRGMGDKTKIEWSDATWSPVTGCTKVSTGCKNCYAERMAQRLQRMGVAKYQDGFAVRLHHDLLDQPLRWKRPRKVFVNSMSDLFHEDVPYEFIAVIFGVMAAARDHTFQVLTKRPQRMEAFFKWLGRRPVGQMSPGVYWQTLYGFVRQAELGKPRDIELRMASPWPWPLPNVWLGTSIENRDVLWRMETLKHTPAAIRFLSCEPLLGDLGQIDLDQIDWVIAGGESGPKARPMQPEWARSIRDQCAAQKVAFFFKQWGGINKKVAGRDLDGRTWDDYPSARV